MARAVVDNKNDLDAADRHAPIERSVAQPRDPSDPLFNRPNHFNRIEIALLVAKAYSNASRVMARTVVY